MSVDVPSSTSSVQAPSSRPGADFGRYRLLHRIGSGGMAEIFRAVAVGEQGFERTVAIKRIREEVIELADIGKLFADEARVSALLDHPNIVQVYDFGAVDGMYYIAMEYLKGRNLEQVLSALRQRGRRLAPSLAVLIARDVARGLAYAHALTDEQGRPLSIVHRDVSPANIMLSHMGAVKLLDFGIARITSELRLAVTRGKALRGKCPYLAPEQITNEGETDGRADIFALGAVLWEMLTGRRLFVGSSDFEVLASVLNREIALPSSLAPELPPEIDEIVLRALARDPRQRYQSAEALASSLDEVMQLLPSRYGDLTALVASLPPQPSEELRLPVPAAGPVGARFELVLPPGPTPGIAGTPDDPTRLDLGCLKNAETKKVSAPELLAQLSRNPDKKPPARSRPPRRLMLGLAMGLLMLGGGLGTLTNRKPAAPAAPAPAQASAPAAVRPAAPAEPASPAPGPGSLQAAAPTVTTKLRGLPGTATQPEVKSKRTRARSSRSKTQANRRPTLTAGREAPQPIAQGGR